MSASNGPEEKDLTLIDLLECPDILELGVTEENEAKKRVAAIVDELQINAQIKCEDGDVENYQLLFKIGWQKHHTSVMPKQYRTEQNRTAIQKAVLDQLKPWQEGGDLPPVPIVYDSVDVIPLGVLLDCSRMPADQFSLIVQQSKFNQQTKLEMSFVNSWGIEEKFEEGITITIGRYATESEQKYVFSITFPSPMMVCTVTDANAKVHRIVKPPGADMVDSVFKNFGVPHYRSDMTQRDVFYLDETNMVGKNRWTAYYTEIPTQTLPLFYSVIDGDGKEISAWSMTTKCYRPDEYNVCDFCRFDIDNIEEGGTHECTRVGNLIPSFRKQTQKKQYETKQKSLKGILKAQKQKRQAAEYMKKLQEERLTRSPNHQKTNKEVVSSPPSKQNKQL